MVRSPRRLHNLPAQRTSFIGREREIAEIKHLLGTTRLLTLTGSGGCGKTRLALRVAADLLEQYPDGVWLVELGALADPALVPNSVAAALDIPEQPNRPMTETLANYLRTRNVLLLIDGCEHLHAACQNLIDHLLRTSAIVRILATSRQTLGIEGELRYRVPSVRLPDVGHPPPAAQPRQRPLTAEKIAINAIMAGCLPAHMPVVLAVIRAMCAPEFNLHGCTASKSII